MTMISMQTQRINGQQVEINRMLNSFTTKEDITHIDYDEYAYIKEVSYLDNEHIQQKEMTAFFSQKNKTSITILPWYQGNQFLGYLKFEYQIPNLNITKIIWIIEGSLFILEGFLLFILFYIKMRIIHPFDRLSSLPEKLAKGHLKGDIKVEKGKYFKQYLWSMSQLQDTLDVSKKRQLDLMKEKKQMLLSLSHDIKTPLNLIKLYNKGLQEDIYQDTSSRQEAMIQIDGKVQQIEQYVDKIIKSSHEDILDLQVEQGEFYLQDLLEKVLSVYLEQCKLRNMECIVHPFDNRLLKGDMERSQEIFENLFENAFKYSDGKKIEISFYEEDYCQLISFYSSGNPVNEQEYNHLFDSFFRGTNSKGQAGSGLGLYICHELMTKMGGTIFVEACQTGMKFVLVFR